MIRRIDALLSWAMVLGGLGQWAVTPRFFPVIHEPAAWWFNGGTTLILLGALNLLRLRHPHLRDVRAVAVGANLLLTAFYLALFAGLWYKFVRYPGSIVGPVLLIALTAVSLRRPPVA